MHAIAALRLVAISELLPSRRDCTGTTLTRNHRAVVVIVFSIIVLGLSANLVHLTAGATPSWIGYTLFVSIFTLLITIPM